MKEVILLKSSFGKRLAELRKKRGLIQGQLAERIGMAKSSIASWEIDTREPSMAMIVKLATFFNVTTDHLLGLTDERHVSAMDELLKKGMTQMSRTEMQLCSFSEAIQLLELVEQQRVSCSVEIKIDNSYLDYYVTIVGEIPTVEYEEAYTGDFLTVGMGNTQLHFEGTSDFSKDITGTQITLCIVNDGRSTWLLSSGLSPDAIRRAKAIERK